MRTYFVAIFDHSTDQVGESLGELACNKMGCANPVGLEGVEYTCPDALLVHRVVAVTAQRDVYLRIEGQVHLYVLPSPFTSSFLMNFAGFPAARVNASTSCKTILPAPTTAFSPIVTPGRIMHPGGIHTPLRMRTGAVLLG